MRIKLLPASHESESVAIIQGDRQVTVSLLKDGSVDIKTRLSGLPPTGGAGGQEEPPTGGTGGQPDMDQGSGGGQTNPPRPVENL